jgi:hypothetical protein
VCGLFFCIDALHLVMNWGLLRAYHLLLDGPVSYCEGAEEGYDYHSHATIARHAMTSDSHSIPFPFPFPTPTRYVNASRHGPTKPCSRFEAVPFVHVSSRLRHLLHLV